jgi:CMP-2-keto-3-deoxyoctulosonic acid synthetase
MRKEELEMLRVLEARSRLSVQNVKEISLSVLYDV